MFFFYVDSKRHINYVLGMFLQLISAQMSDALCCLSFCEAIFHAIPEKSQRVLIADILFFPLHLVYHLM